MSQQTPTLDQIRNFEGKYPKQLWSLFTIEMWERFCFYGMRGMLTVFMVTQLGLGDKEANLQYGAIQAFVYAFTFIGGVFADKILGFQKSLIWGAATMIVGGLVIAFSPSETGFYMGTCFSIVGTGFFKPNISTMVGQLYHEDCTLSGEALAAIGGRMAKLDILETAGVWQPEWTMEQVAARMDEIADPATLPIRPLRRSLASGPWWVARASSRWSSFHRSWRANERPTTARSPASACRTRAASSISTPTLRVPRSFCRCPSPYPARRPRSPPARQIR